MDFIWATSFRSIDLISFSKYQINLRQGQSLSFYFSFKFSIFLNVSSRWAPVVWNIGDAGLAYFD